MNPRLSVMLTASGVLVTAILLAIVVECFGRRLNPTQRLILALGLSVLSLPALLFGVYYLHVLPEWQWLYEWRSLRASELWLVLPLSAAVAWSDFLKRPLVLASYAGAVGAALVPFAKPILRPLDRSQLRDQWENDACLQSTESTCGPSSAATILRRLGHREANEAILSRQAMSSASGTEAWYLARSIRYQGAHAEFQFGRFPEKVDLPGILGVRLGSIGHFIAVIRRDGDRWVICDPLIGEESVTTAELHRRYQVSDFFLHIE
jgi:hypothetical protein